MERETVGNIETGLEEVMSTRGVEDTIPKETHETAGRSITTCKANIVFAFLM